MLLLGVFLSFYIICVLYLTCCVRFLYLETLAALSSVRLFDCLLFYLIHFRLKTLRPLLYNLVLCLNCLCSLLTSALWKFTLLCMAFPHPQYTHTNTHTCMIYLFLARLEQSFDFILYWSNLVCYHFVVVLADSWLRGFVLLVVSFSCSRDYRYSVGCFRQVCC